VAVHPAIAAEWAKRKRQADRHRVVDDDLRARIDRMRAGSIAKAVAAVRDPSPLVAWFCTRRAGKSRELVLEMAEVAATVPDARVIYLNETRTECERIAWLGNGRDGLLTLNEKHRLGGEPNQSKLAMWFAKNGGLIEMVGADDKRATNKLVGIAPHLVVIDEAQKAPHLSHVVRNSLGPAMMDAAMTTGTPGRIIIAGTPSEDLFGMFYDATREDAERDEAWSMHSWSVVDNPFFGATPEERYDNVVVQYCKSHHLELDSPEVLRAFGPKWVKTDANYVWHVHRVPEHDLCYAPARMLADGSPDIPKALADLPKLPFGKQWEFTLAADLGFDPDPFAVVVWAWSFGSPAIYEVCSFKRHRLLNDEQRDVLDALEKQVGFAITVADAGGQGKTTVAGWTREWQRRWNKPIIEAQKTRRHEHIELLNSDLRGGKVKLRRGGLLIEEAKRATWMPHSGFGKLRENPQTPNDLMDAGLYGHRHTAAYLADPAAKPKPEKGTPAYFEAIEARLEEQETEEQESEPDGYYHDAHR
jgi:hypothetical protein